MSKADEMEPLLSINSGYGAHVVQNDNGHNDEEGAAEAGASGTLGPLELTTEFLIPSVEHLPFKAGHSTQRKAAKAVLAGLLIPPPFGWIYAAIKTVLVKQGNIGLSVNAGRPEILGPGWHCLLSPLRSCSRQVPVTTPVIQHGTITIVTVREGTIGYANDRGVPILLPAGLHCWDSPTCSWEDSFDLSEPVIRIGPYTLVIVRDGHVAVTYDDGKLDIRPAGFHTLSHIRHQHRGFLQLTDQFCPIEGIRVITSDKVGLEIDTTVHFVINDPYAAALKAGNMDEILRLVRREAVACMTATVARSRVDDIGALARSSSQELDADDVVPGKSDAAYEGRYEGKTALFEAAVSTLQNIGVQLKKIAVRRLHVLDPEIASRLASQAVIRTKRLELLDLAEVEKKTKEIQAQADAHARLITARAEADARLIEVDARVEQGRRLAALDAELGQGHGASLDLLEAAGTALANANASTILIPNNDLVGSLMIGAPGSVGSVGTAQQAGTAA